MQIVSGDSDVLDLAVGSKLIERRKCFIQNHVDVGELNVVNLKNVDSMHSESFQTLSKSGQNTRAIVCKFAIVRSSDFGGQVVRCPRNSFERLACRTERNEEIKN